MPDQEHIIHVDMDAFYASVEQLDQPEIRGRAVIVGGDPKSRGVVSAASYEARRYGVHSAMPTITAIKLCPQAVVLPVRMQRYHELSEQILQILTRYSPIIEPLSLDEAFLDCAGTLHLFGDIRQIGLGIKQAIREELHLTASVGIGPNKFLAKLASDLEKPDGFVVVTHKNKQKILDGLPVSRIWGVGKQTHDKLRADGIETIADLRHRPVESLRSILGNTAEEFLQLACGIDHRSVEPISQRKSISSDKTFAADIADPQILSSILLDEVQEVAYRLRRNHLLTTSVTLKFRYENFRTISRSLRLQEATANTETLWQTAKKVFHRWSRNEAGPLRLIGFSASLLTDSQSGKQLELFGDPRREKLERLDKVVDQINQRYGRKSLKRNTGHKRS
ncbi:MAG: DNA polymerase IV [Planctomycetes bacterium]|nr:DNA polymerase IV [Planctomycetota bacterium]